MNKCITTARFSRNKIQGDLFGGKGKIIAKFYVLSDGGGIIANDPSIDLNKLYEDRPILVSYIKKGDSSNTFFKPITDHAVIVIANNDDMVMDDARAILNEELPEKPAHISFDNYLDVCQSMTVEVFKNAGEADVYSRALRHNFPNNSIFLTTAQFDTIFLYSENFSIPSGEMKFPEQKDIVVIEAPVAYSDAIAKNVLSDNAQADNYAGLYRYMFSDTSGNNYFKHLDTRNYIKVAA